MPTIKDVAKACGVGISTVSYALNDSQMISDETKKRIKKVAQEMGYIPNAYARSLKSKKTYRVCAYITDFGGTIHPTILNGISQVFAKSNYQLIVTLTNEKMTLIKDKSLDLAILMDQRISEERIFELNNYCKLIVYDNNYLNTNEIHQVSLQNENAIYEEANHLINLGAKRIAFMLGPKMSWHNHERYLGYLKAMNEAGLETIVYDANSFIEDDGYRLMKDILSGSDDLPFEAIICSNDELAFGTINAMKEAGFNVPKDCMVAGFDNVDKAALIDPSLTTINIDWFKCGETIAKLALSILEGKKTKKHITIPANLVVRNSTKRN